MKDDMKKYSIMNNMVKAALPSFLFALLPSTVSAQEDFKIIRGNCMPEGIVQSGAPATTTPSLRKKLPAINTIWDAEKVYKQMVILIEFSDETFDKENIPDPKDKYNHMLNEPGYNENNGVGCMADYFRTQSGGLLNLQFDVFGPVTVSQKAQPYEKPTSNTRNYGSDSFKEATNKVLADNPDWDYKQYDWNGNGYINQVIFVYAGIPGNISIETAYGHIWPNTSSFTTITTPDGVRISNYTASGEKWPTSSYRSCGIGTICHEFTHSLGLPDIYPTSSSMPFSAVDEWDLMDGGNFTNYGWCPPNYSPIEKMLLGWMTPVELTDATTITDMKPIDQGGETYIVKHTDSEYLLLENRQWNGWDAGLPGKGLVIWHINYNISTWNGNTVNNTKGKYGCSLFAADNMDYDAWDEYMSDNKLSTYRNSQRMNNYHLSGAPYPLQQDNGTPLNDSLTDVSAPAALMFNKNADGSNLLGKSISNIKMTADGLVSFDFMGGDPTGICASLTNSEQRTMGIYDLQGRRISSAEANSCVPSVASDQRSSASLFTPHSSLKKGLYIVNGKKVVK